MSPVIAAPVIITPPPVPPPVDPDSNAPPTLTITYYRQLAAHLMAALDEISAILPQVDETGVLQRTGVATKPPSGHHNIPIAFLNTAVDSTEQLPELQVNNKLDVNRGRDTLQLIDAFRTVQNRAAAFGRGLGLILDSRQSTLALESLDTYSLAQSLARDKSNVPLNEAVDNMQRALGRRGRRKKKVAEPEPASIAALVSTLTARTPEVGKG